MKTWNSDRPRTFGQQSWAAPIFCFVKDYTAIHCEPVRATLVCVQTVEPMVNPYVLASIKKNNTKKQGR